MGSCSWWPKHVGHQLRGTILVVNAATDDNLYVQQYLLRALQGLQNHSTNLTTILSPKSVGPASENEEGAFN